MPVRRKTVKAGEWRTVESFWNATGTAFFREPPGGRIRVRYGGWIFSGNTQKQTLDGRTIKRLNVGRASLAYARMQMRVAADALVTYYVEPGSIANLSPDIDI